MRSNCTFEQVARELNISVSQVLALFARVMRKISDYLNSVKSRDIEKSLKIELPRGEGVKDLRDEEEWDPNAQSLDMELDEASKERMEELRKRQQEIVNSFDLSQ